GDIAKPGRLAVFEAAGGEELHADADAEERASAAFNGVADGVDHAVNGVEIAPAVAEGAVARQDHAIRVGNHVRITRYNYPFGGAGCGDYVLECLRRRPDV